MYILGIVGSPRASGNSNYLTGQALEEAASLGARTGKVMLSELSLKPCLAHEDCRKYERCLQQDDGQKVLDDFRGADGVILATPVYYYDVSAWMKTFIDRNYFLGRHGLKCKARAVGIVVVGGGVGMDDTVNTMKRFVNSSSFKSIGDDRTFIVSGYALDPGDARNDRQLTLHAREMARSMVESLKA